MPSAAKASQTATGLVVSTATKSLLWTPDVGLDATVSLTDRLRCLSPLVVVVVAPRPRRLKPRPQSVGISRPPVIR